MVLPLNNDCCCGARCALGGKCDSQHKCFGCERFIHAICGTPLPEDSKRSICYATICFDCGDKKKSTINDNNDKEDSGDDSANDDMPLAALGNKRKAAPAVAKGKKKQQRKPKAKKKKARPAANYNDDPTVDASNWVFPVDKPEYLAPFIDFMSFVDTVGYPKSQRFSKAKLISLQPKHVLAYLTHKAFGKTTRSAEDRPKYARSNHIKNIKMKLSYFMPSGAGWVDLSDGSGHGNPTKHRSINKLIADIIKFEVRDEGSSARDVRDQIIPEFERELELFRTQNDPLCRYRNPLMGIYGFNFITRTDDVCNFKMDAPKGHSHFSFCLAQSVNWSKNVRDKRNCPDQLLLASMDHKTCIHIATTVWLEFQLGRHPDAEYKMTHARPTGKSKEEHKKFIHAISKTYRNRLVSVVFNDEEFKSLYKGNDKRPLGLHSKRKMGSTQAKRRGAASDQVDHRGRWVGGKKGSRIVNQVYIDPEDMYADAFVASKLALGGPIKYKLLPQLEAYVTTEWLSEHVVPNIAQRFSEDAAMIRTLGLAMLWLCLDDEASEDINLEEDMRARVVTAYAELVVDDKPPLPVMKVPVHVYRMEDETCIDEIMQQREPQQGGTVGDHLAQVPVQGGGAAQQHVLQTVVVQQRNLQRQLEQMQVAMHNMDQNSRVYMENKFRVLNNNIRRFGGTIQGGFVRQDPNRQAEVRQERREAGAARANQPNFNPFQRRRRHWPKLTPNIKDLNLLWGEYQHGLVGQKAAKDWTREERGGGGDSTVKQTYYRRNTIWKLQQHLVNKGMIIHAANMQIEATYGRGVSLTNISKAIVRDRRVYSEQGGFHPNLR